MLDPQLANLENKKEGKEPHLMPLSCLFMVHQQRLPSKRLLNLLRNVLVESSSQPGGIASGVMVQRTLTTIIAAVAARRILFHD